MAPKKKANKKNDDWDADLGETVDPVAAVTQAAKDADAAADADEADSAGAGGLLAVLKNNKKKRVKKGKAAEDFVQGEDPEDVNGTALNGTSAHIESDVDLAAKAPQEADMENEDVFDQPTKKAKGSKNQKQAEEEGEADAAEAIDEDNDDEDASGKVKSKKEKEREKKEREKQRKKEQAAKKKTTAPASESKLSTANATMPAADAAQNATSPPTAAAPDPSGKKKKVPAHLAALQKQQEELRRQQEEKARLEAEEKARIEEEERKAKEEEEHKLELKRQKKLREKERIEQQKKEGKYLTKAQKEAQQQAKQRMQQMIESGAKIAGLQDASSEKAVEEKKKIVYDNKRRKGGPKKLEDEQRELDEAAKEEEARRKLEELRIAEEQKRVAETAEEGAKANAAADQVEESDELDDWEAQADANDGVKDSWDAPSEDEEASPATSKSVIPNGKPKEAGSVADNLTNKEHTASSKVNGLQSGDPELESEESESDVSDDEATAAKREAARRKKEAAERRERRHEEALAARSKDHLRSPICCILGHVDTGKTKLLDKIRQTNVQEGEAGGITQQIGATYFPVDALQKKTAVVNKDNTFEFRVPGLLIIDTPGHESFTNLRSRGSSLCNIAILVVDITHGLQQQTLESMKLLRDRKTPFIVALNKVDRLYGWSRIDNNGIQDSLSMQKKSVIREFEDRVESTKVAFAEQGFNAELFYQNKNMAKFVSLVPTSAHTGEGIPDMIKLLVQLTQERMTNNLMYLSEVECTILEVKVVEGLGTTIDVVLSNGILHEGDRIVLCGLNGPIATNIRALLTPAEMKELRVKSQYVHHKEVKAALGVKIAANDLEHAIAGSRLLVVGPDDDEEDLEEEVMSDLETLLSRISTTGRGVCVQASTLGSLEALLEFLKQMKIPVSNISIGPVYKRDVMQAGIMLEKAKEYAVMLCFDVKVDKEAQAYADEVGVKIFTADIIYHLFDEFTKHQEQLVEQKKEASKLLAVFPCVLKPVAVFNKKDPIVVGVDVIEGSLRKLTPIAAVKHNPVTGTKEIISLGRVSSIERDHKEIPLTKAGQPSVAVKIEGPNQPLYGRQLEEKDMLFSHISRQSIDVLKEFYRTEVSKDEWALIRDKLKPMFDIM